ncbi:MAG: TPM domain-containing protein, partial [Burkholderiales bacterium]|nr:TPM domain-containing protein [Burkholderiales bacterium]
MLLSRLRLAVALVALAAGAAAQPPLVPVPKLESPVTDLTGTLSADERASLEREIRDFEARKGSQIAVLVVPTTQPEAIEQFGIRVAEAWKVGRKGADDGVILIVAKNDKRLRIEVGYGLEGAIPDAYAKRIITETIAPRFAAGDFAGGIDAGVKALMKLIEGEPLPPPKPAPQPGAEGDLESVFVIVLVASMVLGGILTAIFGRFFGSAATGGLVGVLTWLIVGAVFAGVVGGVLAFVFSLLLAGTRGGFTRGTHRGRGGWTGGGWSGGGWGGG